MRLSRKGQSKLSQTRARAGHPRSNEKAIRPGDPKHVVERTEYESSATLPVGAFRIPWTTGTYPVDEVNESCRTESSPMQQVERCCFRESRRKDLLLLILKVGQQDSLAQTIDTAAASGVEFGNGKNSRR